MEENKIVELLTETNELLRALLKIQTQPAGKSFEKRCGPFVSIDDTKKTEKRHTRAWPISNEL